MNYIPSQSCHPCDVLYSTKSYCSNELHPNAFALRNHFTGDLVSYITTVTCNVFPVTYLCCMVSAKEANEHYSGGLLEVAGFVSHIQSY